MSLRHLAVLPVLLLSWSAQAECISCSCTISTPSLAFPPYHPLSSAHGETATTMSVSCTGSGSPVYSIALSSGASGAYASRRMANGSNHLYYNLYTSSSYGTVWGDGTEETSVVTGSMPTFLTGTRTNNHTVYGRIPGAQKTAVPGSYADTITVTVIYN